jgi:hypothetical protein
LPLRATLLLFRLAGWRFDLRAVGLCDDLTVRPERAGARERLLSSQYFASRNPRTEPRLQHFSLPPRSSRTDSPFLRSCPRQAVLRASLRLAPCFSTGRCRLPETKTRDASDRRLPLERLTCTRTSCVPDSLTQLSLRGHPAESWAPQNLSGDRVFHDTRERFGGPTRATHRHGAPFSTASMRRVPHE